MDFSTVSNNFSYLMVGAYPDGPLGGAALTFLIAIAAGIAATLLGTVLGVALAVSRGWWVGLLVLLLGFFRAIPVIMLIFWAYFLLPILFGMAIPAIGSVICALALIYAAYIAHAVKAGIIALKQGPWYAGLSLGLSRPQVLVYIILPQALRMMLPSFINQWIGLIKDTSLAYVVSVAELTYIASQINGDSYGIYSIEIFAFTGLVYFVFCSILDLTASYASRYFSPHLKR